MLKSHCELVEPKRFHFSVNDKIGSANHNALGGVVNTALAIPFGKAGMGFQTDLINAGMPEFRIGQVAVSDPEGDLVRTAMASPIYPAPRVASRLTCWNFSMLLSGEQPMAGSVLVYRHYPRPVC